MEKCVVRLHMSAPPQSRKRVTVVVKDPDVVRLSELPKLAAKLPPARAPAAAPAAAAGAAAALDDAYVLVSEWMLALDSGTMFQEEQVHAALRRMRASPVPPVAVADHGKARAHALMERHGAWIKSLDYWYAVLHPHMATVGFSSLQGMQAHTRGAVGRAVRVRAERAALQRVLPVVKPGGASRSASEALHRAAAELDAWVKQRFTRNT